VREKDNYKDPHKVATIDFLI